MKKIIILLSLVLITGCSKEINKFEELGYNSNEVEMIEKLNNKDIITEYNPKIIEIIFHKEFKENNLEQYIEFYNKYNFSLDDIMYVVNNNYYDKSMDYTDDIIALMKEKYYVHSNLSKYLDYKNKKNIDYYNIVLNVNVGIDNAFYTNTSPTDLSKNDLVLVNKFNYLEKDYVPDDMVTIESKYGVNQQLKSNVYEQYKKMWDDAKNNGLSLYINSPYRSYSTQNYLYNNYASRDGYTLADTYSARPGFSEHQTGLAFDVTSRSTNFDTFAYSNEYEWLQENAYKYGFILRYPKGKEYITGYQYESWHYRYVGTEVAKKIKDENITFEEYYAYYVK